MDTTPPLLLKSLVARRSKKSLESLISVLNVEFRDRSLLDIALLHRSYASQHQIAKDNERLEYLGDGILNACVSGFLFRRFPEKNEGDLTKIRARLVSRRKLKEWGEKLELKDYILLGEEVEKYIDASQTHIIENTVEAIIGAIYLDKGFKTVYEFVKNYMEKQNFHKIVDFKSRLQEYSVERFKEIPAYTIISEIGLPHRKKFEVEVSLNGKVYGRGAGSSKKTAQQNAAEKAYKKLIEKQR